MRILALLLLVCMGVAHAGQPISRVEVFTYYQSMPSDLKVMSGKYAVDVYTLDAVKKIEAFLADGMPSTEAEATAFMKDKIKANEKNFEQAMMNMHHGFKLAKEYGLERTPATVINKCFATYSNKNIAEAINQWRAQGQCLK